MAAGDGEPLALASLAESVRAVHCLALSFGGGREGEYPGRVEAACARAFQTAFGEDLYPSDLLKAAALFHGLIAGHAFTDGNKRTATLVAITALLASGYMRVRPSDLQVRLLGEVAIEAALAGSLSVEQVAFWMDRILGG